MPFNRALLTLLGMTAAASGCQVTFDTNNPDAGALPSSATTESAPAPAIPAPPPTPLPSPTPAPPTLLCSLTPLAGSTGNMCTLVPGFPVPATTPTYSDDGSTCTGVFIDSATGDVSFTAPAKGSSCVIRIRATETGGVETSITSSAITGQNNPPNAPSLVSCPDSPFGGATAQSCAVTAAFPVDEDGDTVTYSDGGSSCAGVAIDATTGNVTFTAPNKGGSCQVKVRTHDGVTYSTATSSTMITGTNNAPSVPSLLACTTTPAAGTTGNACTLTAAIPVDPDGDSVTYSDDGSTCPFTSVNSATGNATFTAPAKSNTCVVKVKAHDGTTYSNAITSGPITGQNNAPTQPAALSCPANPPAGNTGNSCTLAAASPVDPDGDTVTYVDNSSTCADVTVNATSGTVSFTAPAAGENCSIRVRAYDGALYSGAVTSSIGGGNNPPNQPDSLSCPTAPTGGSTGNSCTLTAASPVDANGDSVTYSDDGSTCADVSVNAATGNATFTAPAKGSSCIMRVRAHDGQAYSSAVSSATITAQNNTPNTPDTLFCMTTPAGGSTGNACTLTPASPVDSDGDPVTYSDDGSTCPSTSVTSATGNATFTAPASGEACVVKVRAHDGSAHSATVSSAIITAQNNAPNPPADLSCVTTPLAGSTGNNCTLTATTPADPDGQSVTYADDSSTCASVSVNATSGNATFTAPAKNATCIVRVKAYDGAAYSNSVSSTTITGQNNAPNQPQTLTCTTDPVAQSAGNACTLTPASTIDADGDSVTYSDDGSTCTAVSVDSGTGNATFTAPAKGATCVVKIRAHDGTTYSSTISSLTITGQNNAPNTPAVLSCDTSPLGGSTGNACTLTAASPLDPDGDSVTYANNGSTCGAVSVNSATGAVTFTAPAKAFTCEIKVRAYDGSTYSGAITSIITGQNNTPDTPTSLVCPTTPTPGSTGNACTLTAALTADLDGDAVTYSDDGSTCPAASVSSDGATITYTAPASGVTCVMKVKAHDGTVYSSAVSSATITGTVASSCPPNFTLVPGNPTYGTSDFCVAKYPMKAENPDHTLANGGDGSGLWTWVVDGCFNGTTDFDCWIHGGGNTHPSAIPASRPDGTPWSFITRQMAIDACGSLGTGYHLITNAEWQTIARNIEGVYLNWSGGFIGGGMINRGHSDSAIDASAISAGLAFEGPVNFHQMSLKALASSAATIPPNDANGYVGTGNSSGQGLNSGWEQKRTHTLSNGEVIWDFAGNISQWVADTLPINFGSSGYISSITNATHPLGGTIGSISGTPKLHFGPAGAYGSTIPYAGLGYFTSGTSSISRGGAWLSTMDAGIFAAKLTFDPTLPNFSIGFRCAYTP